LANTLGPLLEKVLGFRGWNASWGEGSKCQLRWLRRRVGDPDIPPRISGLIDMSVGDPDELPFATDIGFPFRIWDSCDTRVEAEVGGVGCCFWSPTLTNN
jgi:hypothetical protein